MLNKLSRFIERHLQPAGGSSPVLSDHQKQLAVASLLVEVAMADHQFSEVELHNLTLILERKFSLSLDELTELISLAKNETNHATSLHQFTQLINQYCTTEEKFKLMKAMWEMAYADNDLDKYEDYIIRKVADLIYVPHTEFIRAKSLVKASLLSAEN
ncbi:MULTISPECIES: TerB family tellurite resistance protein [Cellvibrio]|uniref:Tellurite resistance protein B-like protein n=1 Tax=Cellvibrio fibrivorans TaxID=126350 RepID=A0ABU1UV99_9GAMM|nr:TerB family tellurite resistance protein [Cellvibrio fibrivorans]MDR7089129.1 putative tellurite resistance protein B-like protein [Cellvibrio fibrivorans]